jgi:predicted double-glycine peptidase
MTLDRLCRLREEMGAVSDREGYAIWRGHSVGRSCFGFVAIWLCALLIHPMRLQAGNRDHNVHSGRGVLRDSVICGPHAVYIFLLLSGANPSEDVIDSIDCGEEGMSLLDMKKVVEAGGVAADVRLYSENDLLQMPLPAICQTKPGRNGLKHFFVAYGIDATGILMIDPTDGEVFVLRRDHVAYLNGYALVWKPPLLQSVFRNGMWQCMFLMAAIVTLVLAPCVGQSRSKQLPGEVAIGLSVP